MVKSVCPPGARDINHVKFPLRCFWVYPAAVTDHPTLTAQGSLGFHQNLGKSCQTLQRTQQTNSTDFSEKQSTDGPRNPTRMAKRYPESETLTPGAGYPEEVF